jgi:hypothetical protein
VRLGGGVSPQQSVLLDDDRLSWAWEAVDAEGWHDPEHKWPLILALLDAAASEHEVASSQRARSKPSCRCTGATSSIASRATRTNAKLQAALAGERQAC